MKLNWDPSNSLGIMVRGTGYLTGRAGNLKVPDLTFITESIKDICERNRLNKLYIATEDFRLYKSLTENLSSYELVPSIRFNSALTLENWEKNQRTSPDESIRMGYDKTLDYLTEVLLVSDCTNTLSVPTNVALFMLICSNDIKHQRHVILTDKLFKI